MMVLLLSVKMKWEAQPVQSKGNLSSLFLVGHKDSTILVYVTISLKISLKLQFGYFEMCIILIGAAPADYFGI